MEKALHLLTITICKSIDDHFYFRLRDPAGTVIMTSEEYDERGHCVDDVRCMLRYHYYGLLIGSSKVSNTYSFKILELGGRVLARSKHYYSFREMHADIELVQSSIELAEVVDSSQVTFFRPVSITR